MFTEGRSEGGKDRIQFRFLRRQSSSAEFADAIFQSAARVHAARWARVLSISQSRIFPNGCSIPYTLYFCPQKTPIRPHPEVALSVGKLFPTRLSSKISSPVISTCKSGCCKDGFSGTGSNCGSPLAFSILMSKLEERDWRKLCELVTKETDPLKLDELLEQLTEALDARVKQLDIHSYSSTPNRDRRCRLKPI
jgi:hypothetical protein